MKQLIVNADDFGLTPGINRGVEEAHQNGILTSVLILAGIQLISTGLIGELLSRTYFESQNRPIYSIARIFRSKENQPDRTNHSPAANTLRKDGRD